MTMDEYYLPEPYETIERIAGAEAALEVARRCGGVQMHMAVVCGVMNRLPEPYATISEFAGMGAALEVAKIFSGERMYFAKYDTVVRPLRDRQIKAEFNGGNILSLAKKYGMTEQGIRKILTKKYIFEKKHEPIDGQVSLFDD